MCVVQFAESRYDVMMNVMMNVFTAIEYLALRHHGSRLMFWARVNPSRSC